MYGKETENFILNNFDIKNLNNKKFLTQLRNVLTKETGTTKLVKKIIPMDLSIEKTSTIYDYGEKIIAYDINLIIKYLRSLKRKRIISDFNNIKIVTEFYQNILHENGHAFQDLLCFDEKDRTPFVESLRDSIKFHDGYFDLNPSISLSNKSRIKAYKIYKTYHNLFPGERHADMISYDFILKICLNMFPDDIDLITEIKYVYSRILRYGYSNDTCPLKEFYKLFKHEEIYNSYDFSSYNRHERIIYGMSLTKAELREENMRILTL